MSGKEKFFFSSAIFGHSLGEISCVCAANAAQNRNTKAKNKLRIKVPAIVLLFADEVAAARVSLIPGGTSVREPLIERLSKAFGSAGHRCRTRPCGGRVRPCAQAKWACRH